jgi:hypothetical protein
MSERSLPMPKPSRLTHPALGAVVLGVSLFGTNFLLEAVAGSAAAVRLAIILLPVAAFLYWVWTLVQWYKLADEMWQRILLTVWTYSFVTSALGALLLYYLQRAGFFPPADYPNLEYWGDVLPYSFAVGFLLGWIRAKRRYQ